MTRQLQLALLGRADVRQDGEPVTGFYSSKAQALLFYLAVTGTSHSRAALAGLLWADVPEADARTNLRQADCYVLSSLHEGLGISDNLVRISVGIEHPDDLQNDLDHALAAI